MTTPPSSAEVKNAWSYLSLTSVYLHGVDRDNFTFYTIPILFALPTVVTVGFLVPPGQWRDTEIGHDLALLLAYLQFMNTCHYATSAFVSHPAICPVPCQSMIKSSFVLNTWRVFYVFPESARKRLNHVIRRFLKLPFVVCIRRWQRHTAGMQCVSQISRPCQEPGSPMRNFEPVGLVRFWFGT